MSLRFAEDVLSLVGTHGAGDGGGDEERATAKSALHRYPHHPSARFPGRWRLHRATEPFVRLRWRIEAGKKISVSLGAHGNQGAVEEGVFGGAAGGVQNEVCAARSAHLRSTVNQSALFRADADEDADVERLSRARLPFAG